VVLLAAAAIAVACLTGTAATATAAGAATAAAAAAPAPVTPGAALRLPFHRALAERTSLIRYLLSGLGSILGDGAAPRASSAALSGSPAFPPVLNPKTHTLYVPIQCTNPSTNATCNATASNVVDVINTATCTAAASAHCRVVARARAGRAPLAAVVDEVTDTVYVANGSANTVSVIDGATCNATVTRGCGRPLATVKVGIFPVAGAVNDRTHTLYVVNAGGNTLSVINVASCNATTTRGCGQPARTLKDKAGPAAVAIDTATDTVYAANSATPTGNSVSVFNGATCDGATGRGCGQAPRTITVGNSPFWIDIDQATHTLYVANEGDGTVSVVNGAACNAKVATGCHRTPPAVPTGADTGFLAIDSALHTVFALNQVDDTLSAINMRTCNGKVTAGCAKRPPNQQVAWNAPRGYNPNSFALNLVTGTAYMVNSGGESFLQAVHVTRCDAITSRGCRVEAPNVPDSEYLLSFDPATGTIYGGSQSSPQIDVINGATCRAGHATLTGCKPVATIPTPDPQANVGAIDDSTHTLYASDESPTGTLMVINTATCNVTDTSGCSTTPASVAIGPFPSQPVLDPATHTVYASYGNTSDLVAVVDAATCNATDTGGCGHAVATAKVGPGTFNLALSAATDTIYAASTGLDVNGDTVSVLNGATCDAANTSGCGHLAATVKVGVGPASVVVDAAAHTVYVVDNANGDLPGTVSMIDSAVCNGTVTTGCGKRLPVMATGRSPVLAALDATTRTLYVADNSSAEVTILNLAHCDAADTSGCGRAAREQAVGSLPIMPVVNPATHSVYVTDLYGGASMSVFGE
jgi:DNA-binding beta-propeller fold protein YncE